MCTAGSTRYDTPMTASSIKEYGSAVWNTGWAPLLALDHPQRLGSGDPRKPGGFAVSAYESAIRAAGNRRLQP